MPTVTRLAVVASVLMVLVSPSRVFSAHLPLPCYERCSVTDADCIDTCQRELNSESETGEFPGVKRASAFVRIGRPALDKRASSFIRIGKKLSPADAAKRKDTFVRIGRASAFVRIGRGENGENDHPKRASSFVRIGRSSNPADSAIEVDTTGNNKRTSSFVRIGRDDHHVETADGRLLSRW